MTLLVERIFEEVSTLRRMQYCPHAPLDDPMPLFKVEQSKKLYSLCKFPDTLLSL
jgi:hypothetical protein